MNRCGRLLRAMALAVSVLLAPDSLTAQSGWYVKLGSGLSLATDASMGTAETRAAGYEADEIGQTVVMDAAIGRSMGQALRVELGVTYHPDFAVDEHFTGIDVTAEISSINVMANLLYNPNLGSLQPFVGAGVGWARNEMFDIVNTSTAGETEGLAVVGEGAATTEFAWQVMGGVGIPVRPGLTMDLGYRYIDLGGLTAETPPGGSAPDGDLRVHGFMVALRYALN